MKKINQVSGRADEQLCLIILATAVLVFAAIAVIYAAAVLTVAYLWVWTEVDL